VRLYGLLLPYAQLSAANVPEGLRGSVSRYLGLLAGMLEQWSDADSHFSHALEANGRMGLRPWLARTQEDYARLLRARDSSDPRARELIDAAVATYGELGMESHARSADRSDTDT
jgi:hypothetical protein